MKVVGQILKQNFEKLYFVLGFLNHKDLNSIISFFPKNGCYYFCGSSSPHYQDLWFYKEKQKLLHYLENFINLF